MLYLNSLYTYTCIHMHVYPYTLMQTFATLMHACTYIHAYNYTWQYKHAYHSYMHAFTNAYIHTCSVWKYSYINSLTASYWPEFTGNICQIYIAAAVRVFNHTNIFGRGDSWYNCICAVYPDFVPKICCCRKLLFISPMAHFDDYCT